MTSTGTVRGGTEYEGQDHDEVPSAGEVRFLRVMRVVCGLAVPVAAAAGLARIVDGGTEAMEVVAAILAVAFTALFCAYSGARARQLQTLRDEATAASSTNPNESETP
ncbi:hypothetical protein [Glycomyces sp. MUSA5-2]|uniref:hypothetical protein n=1 Tax=Glycomyces sp. MUSA5-2 TaxID=2053002 RepID=UPI00300AB589